VRSQPESGNERQKKLLVDTPYSHYKTDDIGECKQTHFELGYQMTEIIIILGSFVSSVSFLLLARSKKNFDKLVENEGEEFVVKTTISINKSGIVLMVIALGWSIVILFQKFLSL
jgi:hypothetical protein